jgi:hypothetical protein
LRVLALHKLEVHSVLADRQVEVVDEVGANAGGGIHCGVGGLGDREGGGGAGVCELDGNCNRNDDMIRGFEVLLGVGFGGFGDRESGGFVN